jgi:hypothetical protein
LGGRVSIDRQHNAEPEPDQRRKESTMPGKRVQIDEETWPVLDLLARDRMMTFQELADEAFADLLKKHGRPVTLKAALRKSAGHTADIVPIRKARKRR